MKKRMFIVGLAITVAAMLSVLAFGDTYTYNTTGDVQITLTIDTILILDMGASSDDISWVTVTAADLDNGYVVRRAGTSLVVDSNDPDGWTVTASLTGNDDANWTSNGSGTLACSALSLDSGTLQTGSMTTVTTLSNWDAFASQADTVEVASALVQGKDCVIAVDYKIALNWLTAADIYTLTVNYTLAGN